MKIAKKNVIVRIAIWCIFAIWLYVGLFLSSQNGTDTTALSLSLTRWLADLLHLPASANENLHMILRKAAHVIMFFGLGILGALAVRLTFSSRRAQYCTAGVGLCMAFLDEVRKASIPGRHCSWDEAGLNAISVVAGILLVYLLCRKRRKALKNRSGCGE